MRPTARWPTGRGIVEVEGCERAAGEVVRSTVAPLLMRGHLVRDSRALGPREKAGRNGTHKSNIAAGGRRKAARSEIGQSNGVSGWRRRVWRAERQTGAPGGSEEALRPVDVAPATRRVRGRAQRSDARGCRRSLATASEHALKHSDATRPPCLDSQHPSKRPHTVDRQAEREGSVVHTRSG